ncbi:MAG: BON domain-containing protein [Longimicrobiales bacterium]
MVQESTGGFGQAMTRLGIASAIALGAVASGMLLSRSGRRLLGEVWEGRQRTTIEDRVLDALWHDSRVGRRRIDVIELADGTVRLTGAVRDEAEHDRVIEIVKATKGVREIDAQLEIVPRQRRHAVRQG